MPRAHPVQLAIRFSEAATVRQRRAAAEACGLAEVEGIAGEAFTLQALAPSHLASRVRRTRALAMIARHPHVALVRPVFQQGRRRWFATNGLLIEPRAGGEREIRRLVRSGARIVREAHGTFHVDLTDRHDLDAEVRRLSNLDTIEFAEPDVVILGRHHHAAGTPASRLAANQAALRLIDAASGWKAKVASRNVVIAVLDCGVMSSHPDLKAAIVSTFDATSGKRDQSPRPWDSHGTSCAGLALGTHAGAAGVRGVADGCGLMAVRIGKTPTRLGTYMAKTSWLCHGIDWAWEHGADVLSMSYGGGPRSAAVVAALKRARTRGRGGKGAVLVASAGNGDATKTPVEFPATLPWVLAVAATDDQDRPKRSPDNREPWVSASGSAVDIAAPGVGCYTTTVPDPEEGETALYTTDFSGTSASTPLVAGAAALTIGVNPALDEQAVRRILTATADKVRTVTYRNGRNDWVGSGRLNVRSALRAALASRKT